MVFIRFVYKKSELRNNMKIDPYNHKERYLKWRTSANKGIPRLNKHNSDLILKYLDDMENGVNVAQGNVKGSRSYIRLNTLRENIPINKEYKDIGESGSKVSRPQFDKLIKDMRNKSFDTIIVYKLDRIGRSLSHLVKLFEEFKKKNINFISITQSINTTTPEGRMFLHMLMVLAEYERELTIARINSGLDRARAQGKKLGRPKGSRDKKRRRRSGYHIRWTS